MHWFRESTRPEAITARETLNGWYDEMDVSDGKFAARLHSEVEVDFYQALDELYVHHLLKQSNDDIRYEEGDIGPDFRIYEHGECVAGVEVLSLFQQREWTDTQRQHARIAAGLSARVAPDAGYFVDIRIEEAPQDSPPENDDRGPSHSPRPAA